MIDQKVQADQSVIGLDKCITFIYHVVNVLCLQLKVEIM